MTYPTKPMHKRDLQKIPITAQPELSIYEITLRVLYLESLMNFNESKNDLVCKKCMMFWENYYDYLSKHFDVIIPNWILQNVS